MLSQPHTENWMVLLFWCAAFRTFTDNFALDFDIEHILQIIYIESIYIKIIYREYI